MATPPDVIGSDEPSPRSRRRTAMAAVALAALAGGTAAAYVARNDTGRDPGPRAPQTSASRGVGGSDAPTPLSSALDTWLASLPAGPPPRQLLTVDNTLVDASTGTDRVVATVPFYGLTGITTPKGVVLQGFALRGPDSTEPPPAAYSVVRRRGGGYTQGGVSVGRGPFALSADALLAAYADDNDNGTADTADDRDVIGVLRFPSLDPVHYRELTSPSLRVAGFAGDRVLFSSGDGAETAVVQWRPPDPPTAVDDDWSYVEAADPRGSYAVVADHNQCGHLVDVQDGVPDWSEAGVCHRGAAFSHDGSLLTSVESPPGDDRDRLRIRRLPSRAVVAEMDFPRLGDQQLTVVSATEILVVVEQPRGGHAVVHTVVRCFPAESRCEVAWRSDVERDYGGVRVVRP